MQWQRPKRPQCFESNKLPTSSLYSGALGQNNYSPSSCLLPVYYIFCWFIQVDALSSWDVAKEITARQTDRRSVSSESHLGCCLTEGHVTWGAKSEGANELRQLYHTHSTFLLLLRSNSNQIVFLHVDAGLVVTLFKWFCAEGVTAEPAFISFSLASEVGLKKQRHLSIKFGKMQWVVLIVFTKLKFNKYWEPIKFRSHL